jgi:hypothetical protein
MDALTIHSAKSGRNYCYCLTLQVQLGELCFRGVVTLRGIEVAESVCCRTGLLPVVGVLAALPLLFVHVCSSIACTCACYSVFSTDTCICDNSRMYLLYT